MTTFLLGNNLYPVWAAVPDASGHFNVQSVLSTTYTSTKSITSHGVGRSLRTLSDIGLRNTLVRTGVYDDIHDSWILLTYCKIF
jgi:hypothetical protein